MTKVKKPLKREIAIDGEPYTVTVTADGFKLTPKGAQRGIEMTWKYLARCEPNSVRAERHP